ncbi:MAG: glycosyltransferase [Solirubrobacterales bacterium]
MRVLLFHGYLLRGTGSNVYTANVARALAALGHDVALVCQDRRARELDWVHAVGGWDSGELVIEQLREPPAGRVTAYRPDIGRTLPVYVADEYEGFDARPFADLDDQQVEAYVQANVRAVSGVAGRDGGVDAALAGHLIMGPAILARARSAGAIDRYAVKVHGSALEYTVKPHPRFLPFAREGLAGACGVLVGSRHTAESLWAAIGDDDLPGRTRLGPPGVDIDAFTAEARPGAPRRLEQLAAELDGSTEEGTGAFARDPQEAADGLRWLSEVQDLRVLFVGKLLVAKGVDLLVAAWPVVHHRHPGARLLMAGFGSWREGVTRLLAALDAGDLEAAADVARAGRALEGGEGSLDHLLAFLHTAPPDYAQWAREAAGTVRLAGRLEHSEVAAALPAADVVPFTSTFPEAFGMVAAEAAACGALPVSADHSGLREVTTALSEPLEPELGELLRFEVGASAVPALADSIAGWLELSGERRAEIGEQLAEVVRGRWSWEAVARGVIDASQGRLDELEPVSPNPARQA